MENDSSGGGADATTVEEMPQAPVSAMTPQRLEECLRTLKWTPTRLAQWLDCDVKIVRRWLHRDKPHQPIPECVAEWIARWAAKSQEDPPPPSWRWKRPGY